MTVASKARGGTAPTSAPAKSLSLEFIHELGSASGSTAGPIHWTEVIEPSDRPTILNIKAVIVGDTRQGTLSPAYMATVRRRKARTIATEITGLAAFVGTEDFTSFTYPVIHLCREFLAQLADAPFEGYSRE